MIKAKCEPWFEVCASAVLQLEPERTMERVDADDAAIQARLRYLQYDSDHHEERQLMKDAQRNVSFVSLSLGDAPVHKWTMRKEPEQVVLASGSDESNLLRCA